MKYLINYQSHHQEKINEGLREWIVAGALALSGFSAKATEKSRDSIVVRQATDTTMKLDFGSEFASGAYKFDISKSDSLKDKMAQIAKFLQKYQENKIQIKIEGSESRVPNKDAATGKRLKEGELAKLRIKETKNLIEELIREIKKEKDLQVSVDTSSQVGGDTWQFGESPKLQKFKEHQFVTVTLKVLSQTPPEIKIVEELPPTNFKVCGFTKPFSGKWGNPEEDFIVDDNKIDIGPGKGDLYFKFDPVSVPDIFVIEYAGKLYSTGLLGDDIEYYRFAYGTIIANYYKDKPKPEWFKDLKFKQISIQEVDGILKSTSNAHVTDFEPAFGKYKNIKKMLEDGSITPYILEKGQIKPYDDTSKSWEESNWSIKINKVDGEDSARVFAIGVIGQTRWTMQVSCGECKECNK